MGSVPSPKIVRCTDGVLVAAPPRDTTNQADEGKVGLQFRSLTGTQKFAQDVFACTSAIDSKVGHWLHGNGGGGDQLDHDHSFFHWRSLTVASRSSVLELEALTQICFAQAFNAVANSHRLIFNGAVQSGVSLGFRV